jgi:hypothetical protein
MGSEISELQDSRTDAMQIDRDIPWHFKSLKLIHSLDFIMGFSVRFKDP